MLDIRLGGEIIAHLQEARGGRLLCNYTDEVVESSPGGVPLLSCSLLVSAQQLNASGWARGLLPEGDHLARLAAAADVAASDTYGLLKRYGRDVAGAFEIVAGDPPPRTPSFEVYTDESMAEELAGVDDSPLGIYDDSQLSIAGLQDKLLVVRTNAGEWARPRYGYPSTHILKLDNRTHPGLVYAEAACLELARRIDLTNFESWVQRIGDEDVLVVERFDREEASHEVQRLHQEDLLQALGIPPEHRRGRAKYQHPGTHGPPSWWHLADLLDSYSVDRDRELGRLFQAMVFNLVIGNADAHAKNLALLLDDGYVTLSPLYDIVPTQLWPRLRRTLALTIGDKDNPDAIVIDDLVMEAARWSLGEERTRQLANATLERIKEEARAIEHAELSELVQGNIDALIRRS